MSIHDTQFCTNSSHYTMASTKFILPLLFIVFVIVPHFHVRTKAAYWPSFNGFPTSSIDKSYFTHIYHAFVQPNPITYTLDIIPFHQVKVAEL